MNLIIKRAAAALLALSAAVVGAWAAAAPASFYEDFPAPERHWVSLLGPYNEHLVRDVGGLSLALLVVSGWAVARPAGPAARVAGVAWLVFGVQHLAFHAMHLAMFPVADRIAVVGSLAGTVALAALLLPPTVDAAPVVGPGVVRPDRTVRR